MSTRENISLELLFMQVRAFERYIPLRPVSFFPYNRHNVKFLKFSFLF